MTGKQKSKKGKKVRQKAICGEPGCGFRTRNGEKVGVHTRKYGHQFRTTLRK